VHQQKWEEGRRGGSAVRARQRASRALLTPAQLDRYVGRYELAPGFKIVDAQLTLELKDAAPAKGVVPHQAGRDTPARRLE